MTRRGWIACIGVALWLSAPAVTAEQALPMAPETMALMLDVLRHEDTHARMRAAVDLGRARAGSAEIRAELVKLLQDEYPPARASALFALGRSGDVATASSILPLLKDAESAVRIEACRALAELQAKSAAGRLPLADEDAGVRLAAADAARLLASPESSAALQAQLQVEEAPDLRAAQVTALAALADAAPLEAMTRGLADQDPEVIVAALRWVKAHGAQHDELLPKVRSHLKNAYALVRCEAAPATLALARAAAGDVVALLKDNDPVVREKAALALGEHGPAGPAENLAALREDPVRRVRRAGSAALIRMAEREVLAKDELTALALRAVESDRTESRMEGLWILGEIRSEAGFPKLLELAVREFPENTPVDARVSSLVIWIVARTKHAAGAELALAYADAPEQSLRVHATRALGGLKPAEAVPLLARLLKQTRSMMGEVFFVYAGPERTNALWALGEIGTPEALAALATQALMSKPVESDDDLVLIADALARHQFGDKRAIDAMRQIAYKEKGTRRSSLLADLIGKLTGSRPDVPTFEPVPLSGGSFFLEHEDRP